jgi:hypothetical protein
VLDGVDPRLDRGADAGQVMSVGRDRGAPPVGVCRDRGDSGRVELRLPHRGPTVRGRPARHHDLDQVRPVVERRVDSGTQRTVIVGVDLATQEPAVPLVRGQGRPGGLQERTRETARGDGVA